jgi:signal transduction histidine kinase
MSISIFQVAPIFLGGIAAYVGFHHVGIFLRTKKTDRVNLTFALACFGILCYDITSSGLYLSSSTLEGAIWQRFNFYSGQFIAVSLLWFFFDYTSYKKRKIGNLLALYFIISTAASLLGPVNWTLDLTGPLIIPIPALQITYYEVRSGPIKLVSQFCYVFAALFCLFLTINQLRMGKRKDATPLLLVLVFITVGLVNDIAVVSGLIKFIYLTEYMYLGAIMLMTNRISESIATATRAKDEFLENMSHELRTPLNATIGFTDALLEGISGPVTDEQKEMLGTIQDANHQLLKIIETTLEVADIDSNKATLTKERFTIRDLIENVCAPLKNQAEKKRIKINIEFDDKSDQILFADKEKISQVISNLVDNAIKFTPENGECGIKCEHPRNELIVTVWDSGVGIVEDALPKLFQRFRQVDSSITKTYGGTGLGLYYSKKLVELMHGRIQIASKPGIGTLTFFIVPVSEETPPAAEASRNQVASKNGNASMQGKTF